MINASNQDELQTSLSKQLNFSNSDLYRGNYGDLIYTIDVAYQDSKATVGIDIVSAPNSPLETCNIMLDDITGEYESGYFAFYEGDIVIRAIEQYTSKSKIDLVVVDGHGLAHPRRFGLACYVGLKLNIPTIGIAKRSLLEFRKEWLSNEKHSTHTFIVDDMPVGVAIRLQEGINPVFISPGNLIDIKTSVDIIKGLTSEFRLPDNLRRAHHASIENHTN